MGKVSHVRNKAHVRKRGPNTFQIILSLGYGPDGKRSRPSETVKGTSAEAQARKNEMLREYSGQPVAADNKKITVAQLTQAWLDEVALNSELAVKTLERYHGIVLKHINPTLGHVVAKELTNHHVRRFEKGLLAGGMTPKGVNVVHGVLSGALKWAHNFDIITKVVTSSVTPPKVKKRMMDIPTLEGVERVLDKAFASGHPFAMAFHLLARTGARRGEILALSWKDITLPEKANEGATIRIKRSLIRTKTYGVIFADTKTENSRRDVVVSADTAELLKTHQARQAEPRLRLGKDYDGSANLLFADPLGRPLDPQRVTLAFQALAYKEELGKVRLHDLRHVHATNLLRAGVQLLVVSRRLGHKSISITADQYAHVIVDDQKEAVDKYEQLVKAAKS